MNSYGTLPGGTTTHPAWMQHSRRPMQGRKLHQPSHFGTGGAECDSRLALDLEHPVPDYLAPDNLLCKNAACVKARTVD